MEKKQIFTQTAIYFEFRYKCIFLDDNIGKYDYHNDQLED